MRQALVFVLIAVVGLAACTASPVLVPKSGDVPPGVDLSGQWQLRDSGAELTQEIEKARTASAGGQQDIVKPARRSERQRAKNASLLHVFLETGARLKITQTSHGLFISFDRAIVEEYVFGEHGSVSVGPVVAERASGWEGDVYIIETADRKGHKLVELYWLEDKGQTLMRKVSLWTKNEREFLIEQAFDRA